MLGAATMGVATAVFAGMLLRDVFSKGKLPDRLLAVLLAYLLIGSTWEEAYRSRWQHDKIVRSTHGVNCTGSCSWKIYVKGGIVTWETQQTDYPRTRPDLPNHEPRGCARGAS